MVVIDRVYTGGAVQTESGTSFTPTVPGAGGTFTVTDATGYPASGKFVVKLNRGLSDEEKILVDSRSGTTFTVGQRGYDGTSAQSHSNPSVELTFDATALQQLVDHVDDNEADPHSTKLLNNARHDVSARHTFGAALGTPSAPPAVVVNQAASAGSGGDPAREDHVHAGPVSGTPVGVGTANSAGSGTAVALANHVHELNAGSIDSNTFFAAGVVNAAALASDAVTTAKILDANVTEGKIADFTVNDGTPTWCEGGLTLGTGGTSYLHWVQVGNLVVGISGFTLGTGGNVSGAVTLRLPVALHADFHTGSPWLAAGRAFESSGAGTFHSCTAQAGRVTGVDLLFNYATAGTAGWNATVPFNWDAGDAMQTLFVYVAA